MGRSSMVAFSRFWLVSITALCSCVPKVSEPPPGSGQRGGGPIERISMTRTGHSPEAPMSTGTLERDGSITYLGEFNVERIGTFTSTIDAQDFRRLEESFNEC